MMRSDTEYNSITSFAMLHVIYRLNLIGGKRAHAKAKNKITTLIWKNSILIRDLPAKHGKVRGRQVYVLRDCITFGIGRSSVLGYDSCKFLFAFTICFAKASSAYRRATAALAASRAASTSL